MKLAGTACVLRILSLCWWRLRSPRPDLPEDYQGVLTFLARTGDFKAQVLKINVPCNDLHVTIAAQPPPTPFGFGGWVAMTKGNGGTEVLMGDLVLTQEEVNPVLSAGVFTRCPISSRIRNLRIQLVARSGCVCYVS